MKPNDILFNRICQLIAINYALDVKEVLEIYSKTNSIDKTIETIQETR